MRTDPSEKYSTEQLKLLRKNEERFDDILCKLSKLNTQSQKKLGLLTLDTENLSSRDTEPSPTEE